MNYSIKSRIWIETNGDILLGEGRVKLLKAIDKTGSLSKAAKSLNMSYKKAWSLVDAMNSRAEKPIIATSVGGKGGGGASITEYGLGLIKTFEDINRSCWDHLEKEMKKARL